MGDVLQLSWLKLRLKLQEEPVVSSVAWSLGLFQSLVLLGGLWVKMSGTSCVFERIVYGLQSMILEVSTNRF